jgi:exodeoxyribonuclease VII small subunit
MPENKSASFEASLARLQEIVTELEGDQIELARSVELYGEGRKLVTRCEELLGDAEKALREAGNGSAAVAEHAATAAAAPFDELEGESDIPF